MRVQSSDHRLLDLGTAESLRRIRNRADVELRRILFAQSQMNLHDLHALVARWKIDEEDLIEASLAQQLRRHARDVVRRADHEHPFLLLLQPREERCEE